MCERLGTRIRSVVLSLFFCGIVGGLAGCNDTAAKISQESSNLKPLMVLYGQYVGTHRGQPPANEAEFKAYVKALDPAALKSLGVTDVDGLFVSSRDNKPYVILYGPASGPPGPAGQPVIAYEQEGVAGKRYVASTLGAVEEVDPARFQELVPNAR
ncbi:MAG: hypothetical protein U0935_15360 [Pirellulales bacterium]